MNYLNYSKDDHKDDHRGSNDNKVKLPELLAPAGSFEHLKAAVHAGADAVYFGGTRFGARAYAQNFTKEKVIEGLDYLHFHDRKAYMTVNTLVKERELKEDLFEYLLPFYEAGLDGVIVQDMGAASFIRDTFPLMELHGSTQMMITDVSGALQAKKMGMTRVVPARELSMEEVSRIKQETGLEIEVFIHGALCYCYSGQCLFSSMYGGRSGNRGRCAQPCRLPYRLLDQEGHAFLTKEKHLLSPKDLFSLYTLPSMIESGVDSLKIEGRMKNVEYVAGVVAIYRKYLDLYDNHKKWEVEKQDVNALEELYCRTGFTDGYWKMHNGSQMMSIETPRHLGRELGTVQSIQKNKVTLSLTDAVSSKDLLVIPGTGEEELVLTVPSSLDGIYKKKKQGYELVLNVPKTRWLKSGVKVYRRYQEKMKERIKNDILERKIDYPVSGRIRLTKGEPMELSLFSRNDSITVKGACPTEAQNRPITKEDVLRQMKKTGNVPFALDNMEIDLEDHLFVQVSQLKELRQKAYTLLEEEHIRPLRRKWQEHDESIISKIDAGKEQGVSIEKTIERSTNIIEEERKDVSGNGNNQIPQLIVGVYDESCLETCLSYSHISGILLSMDFMDAKQLKDFKKKIHNTGKKSYLSLPHVFRQVTRKSVTEYLEKTVSEGGEWDGIYINNINEMSVMKEEWNDITRIYGASFYQWNRASQKEIEQLAGESSANAYWDLPYELSEKECIDVLSQMEKAHGECLVYGRFPVMLSAQCLKMTLKECNQREEMLYMEDRKKRKLPVTTHCHPGWIDEREFFKNGNPQACYNMIWTDVPRNLIGEDFSKLIDKIGRFRMDFFHMNPSEIKNTMKEYERWMEKNFTEISGKKTSLEHWEIGIE